MHNQSLFFDLLDSSRIEQVPLDIYLTHHRISGVVTNITIDTAELRVADGRRCTIALDRIEAVTIA